MEALILTVVMDMQHNTFTKVHAISVKGQTASNTTGLVTTTATTTLNTDY